MVDVRDIVIEERQNLALATLLVRKDRRSQLDQYVRERLGFALPQGPHRASAGGWALVGTGPDTWLVLCEGGDAEFASSLAAEVEGLASVADQSDAYVVTRLAGNGVREALNKLVAIDLHPSAFAVGDVASTAAAQIGATLWRLDDGADGSPTFEVAVYRSFLGSFQRAIAELL